MFGKMAADTLGISDIGTIIDSTNFDKVDGDDYIMHEDFEKIYFVIKSKSDEYVFTNFGLLHVDGTNAMSKKRTVRRYDFY
ncbi:MAG: PH domain-containing protein, partial [Culicoidibacterales bacterium]